MKRIVLGIVLCLLLLVRDANSIANRHEEWAIGYNDRLTQRFISTDHSPTSVSVWQYSYILRNGGHLVHNHPRGLCPYHSFQDVENAVMLNLADSRVISGEHGDILTRTASGWRLISIATFDQVFYELGGDCLALRKTWQTLCPLYGCIYEIY